MPGKPPLAPWSAPKFAREHPWILMMRNLADKVFDNPIGLVHRTWHADGKRWTHRPPPMSQRGGDDEDLS